MKFKWFGNNTSRNFYLTLWFNVYRINQFLWQFRQQGSYFLRFARKAKSFAIAIPVFLLFFFLVAFSKQTGKSFLPINYLSLPSTHVTKIKHSSLGTLESVSVYLLLVVIPDAGYQHLFNVRVEFKTSQTIA